MSDQQKDPRNFGRRPAPRPVSHTSGERNFAKPAGERKPGERPFAKPDGERKPGERTFARPAAPRRHLAVEAVQDGQTLCRRTIPYATPAQMVHLPIPDLADGSPVEVCCYDDENPAV